MRDAELTAEETAACERAEAFVLAATKTKRQRMRMLAKTPLTDIRLAALRHPDPTVRRWSLSFLDHYANDSSTATFAAALHDPVDFVRSAALHSIACEPCKTEELCAADVVPHLIEVLHRDPSIDLRSRSLLELLQLEGRDDRVRPAIEQSAIRDADPTIRQAATAALQGEAVHPRKQYERSQRRHAGSRPRRAT